MLPEGLSGLPNARVVDPSEHKTIWFYGKCSNWDCPGIWHGEKELDTGFYVCHYCGQVSVLYGSPAMANPELLNGDFEGGFSAREAPQVLIANGWERWYDQALIRPEWKEETVNTGKGRIHSGHSAQKMAMTTAQFDAGIWQRVNTVPGKWYLFSIWGYMWSSIESDPDVSKNPGKMHVMAGVNQWGHWANHYATVYGKEIGGDRYNLWTQVGILFQAWHHETSLFVRCITEWGVKHNDVYWDDASFTQVPVYIGEGPEPPEPPEPPIPPGPGQPVDYIKIAQETSDLTIEKWLAKYQELATSWADLIALK